MAAVTGALQWIRRDDFQRIRLNEAYKVCGEDVELCLDVQQTLGKQVWLVEVLCNPDRALAALRRAGRQQ